MNSGLKFLCSAVRAPCTKTENARIFARIFLTEIFCAEPNVLSILWSRLDLKKLLFTPGPVMMCPETISAGAIQIPYFRNKSFSDLLLGIEAALLHLVSAPNGSRAVFITGSGTAAMEAAVLNFIAPNSLVAIVNGGTFGQRFVDICGRHDRRSCEIKVDRDTLNDGRALANVSKHVDALLINAHETSIGHLYDLGATSTFCKEQDCLHIVDAVSLFGTDPVEMTSSKIDILILSSHKGLAVAPGIAMLVMSPKALDRMIKCAGSYYLDVGAMLADGIRGQTPFTPAIGILLQMDQRLKKLVETGIQASIDKAGHLARHFRSNIAHLPLRNYSRSMPNAMTALEVVNATPSARCIVDILDSQYGLVVAPNGGSLCDLVFRVSHMGDVGMGDVDLLVSALKQITGKVTEGY